MANSSQDDNTVDNTYESLRLKFNQHILDTMGSELYQQVIDTMSPELYQQVLDIFQKNFNTQTTGLVEVEVCQQIVDLLGEELYQQILGMISPETYYHLQIMMSNENQRQGRRMSGNEIQRKGRRMSSNEIQRKGRNFLSPEIQRQIGSIQNLNLQQKMAEMARIDFQQILKSFPKKTEQIYFEELNKISSVFLKDHGNVQELMNSLKPYQDIISSTVKAIAINGVDTEIPNQIFNKISSYTSSLAETIIQLNRLNFLPFERISEKQIRKLYSDSNLINKIEYFPAETYPSPNILINSDGETRSVLSQKDVISLKEFLPDCSSADYASFVRHLGSFPMLGHVHPIGKKIYEELEQNWEEYVVEIDSGKIFYRCRDNDTDGIPIPAQKMFDPPYGKSSINRFNWYGLNHLYMADSLKIAKAEIGYIDSKSVGISSVSAKNRTKIRLFKLDKDQGTAFSFCLFPDSGKENNSHTYFFPNFISQCLYHLVMEKDIQLDGIMYPTVKGEATGSCFVFFNKHFEDFKEINSPAIES